MGASASGIVPTGDVASAAACGSPEYQYLGRVQESGPGTTFISGVSGDVEVQQGMFCTPQVENDSYSSWTLIGAAGRQNAYAQTGYVDYYLRGPVGTFAFSEYNLNGARQFNYYQHVDTHSLHNFKSVYASDCHCIRNYIDHSYVDSSPFDPTSTWQGPWTPQFLEEVHVQGDQVAGSSANPVNYNHATAQIFDGSSQPAYLPTPVTTAPGTVSAVYTCSDGGNCFFAAGQP